MFTKAENSHSYLFKLHYLHKSDSMNFVPMNFVQ